MSSENGSVSGLVLVVVVVLVVMVLVMVMVVVVVVVVVMLRMMVMVVFCASNRVRTSSYLVAEMHKWWYVPRSWLEAFAHG